MNISKLYIDSQIVDFPEVTNIRSRLNIPCEIVDDIQKTFQLVSKADDPVQKGKSLLILTQNRGAFIKKCPGTRHYTCCGYKILQMGIFCTMDCSYCILQTYFHPPVLQYFVNHQDLMKELDSLFAKKAITRIGTGEFTDSLIWESISGFNSKLVEKFSGQSHAVLELKTKTTDSINLKQLKHNRKTIIAWSVNTNRVIKTDERKTSSLLERLKAAAQCESWGYPIAFHFDPMVIYDGCKEDYKQVVDQIFNHVSSKNIVWISFGSFRFPPALKPIIQERFPDSRIVYGEFITGLDGKMRYFKPLRIDLYSEIYSYIKKIAPEVLVYLCMEDEEVWEKSMGFAPLTFGGLSTMLDESAVMHCELERT